MILKVMWKYKDRRIAKSILKKITNVKELYSMIPKLTVDPWQLQQYVIGVKIDTEIIRIEHRSMDQNIGSRSRHMYILTIDFCQIDQGHLVRKG